MPRALSLFLETLLLTCVYVLSTTPSGIFSFVISIQHSMLHNRGEELSPIAVLFQKQYENKSDMPTLDVISTR